MCFLEREVYTFCGERVRGAMPWARIFLFMGGPQETTWGRRWTGRRWAAGSTREEPRAERHRRSDTRGVREKGKKDVFLFLGKRSEGCLLCPPGGSRGRSAAIAALGYRHRRENDACAGCGTERSTVWKPSLWRLVAAEPSLSSLYTLDTYVGAQSGRNGWMSVFSSLCIYSIS